MAAAAARFEDVVAAVERLVPSEHLCMSYGTAEELSVAVAPFVRRGLEEHEACVVIAEEPVRSSIVAALRSADIPVDRSVRTGALSLLRAADAYRASGAFDPERMLAWVRDRARAARNAGFAALRLVGDMACIANGAALDVRKLAEYEARLNDVLQKEHVSALCIYDRRRVGPDVVREVILTHPHVVVGGELYRNPYFVRPDEYLSPTWRDREVDWLLKTLANIERARDDASASEARYRSLSRRLLDVQESERRRVARDLHDHLGQLLTGIKMALQRARVAQRPQPRDTTPGGRPTDALADGLGLADEAIESVRSIALELRPPMLDDLGLAATLRWYVQRQAARAGLVARLHLARIETARFPAPLELTCFRLVQEAVTNVVRHAHARFVDVAVDVGNGALETVVHDDGVGFDVDAVGRRAAVADGLGMLSMEERVSLAGGKLAIDSGPGRGTTVRAILPLRSRPDRR